MWKLLTSKPNLHCVSSQGRTPLLEFIFGYLFWFSLGTVASILDATDYLVKGDTPLSIALYQWLGNLHFNGVNLEEYGRREFEAHKQGHTDWCFRDEMFDGRPQSWYEVIWCVSIFEYGPLPTDWEIAIEELEPDMKSSERVPGGWVEEESEDKDESKDEGDEEQDEE